MRVIQPAGGFVEKQYTTLRSQRAGYGEALLLTSGQALGMSVSKTVKTSLPDLPFIFCG